MIVDDNVTFWQFWGSLFTTVFPTPIVLAVFIIILLAIIIFLLWITKYFVKDWKERSASDRGFGILGLLVIWSLATPLCAGLVFANCHLIITSRTIDGLHDFYGVGTEENDSELNITIRSVRGVFDNPNKVTLMDTMDDFKVSEGKVTKVEQSLYGLYDQGTKKFVLYISDPDSDEMTELEQVG